MTTLVNLFIRNVFRRVAFNVFGVNFSGWGFICQRLVLVPWLGLGICEVSWLYSILLAMKFSYASTINPSIKKLKYHTMTTTTTTLMMISHASPNS